eukprot:5365658-Amphidinium_carterae.1
MKHAGLVAPAYRCLYSPRAVQDQVVIPAFVMKPKNLAHHSNFQTAVGKVVLDTQYYLLVGLSLALQGWHYNSV